MAGMTTAAATMAGGGCGLHDTNRWRLRKDDGRPNQQQAANNSQCRFHVFNLIQLSERSSTDVGFLLAIFGFDFTFR
jgi:hypothetical protein